MSFEFPKRISVCEVGLRDGLQNEARIFSSEEKLGLLNDMAEAGLKVIEVGSFVSPKAVPQMANTDEVFRALRQKPDVEYRALIANLRGVERAETCGCKKVKLNVSASRAHNLANLNCTPEESVAGFAACIARARKSGIGISGSISMAFGSPWEKTVPADDVRAIVKAYLALGVNEISLSDSSGMGYPSQVYALCSAMRREFPEVQWWLHFHNTRGLGLANILAGMQAGFTRFDSSFAGIGGCPFVPGAAGNVSTEDFLHMCDEMNIATGVDLDKSLGISRRVAVLVGHSTDSFLLRAGKAEDLFSELPTGQGKKFSAVRQK